MFFQIDMQSRTPVFQQIKNNVRRFAVLGVLQAGDQLPSVRALASELGINPNTVQKAYRELEYEGVIYALQGRGNFLSENVVDKSLHFKLTELFQEIYEVAKENGLSRQDLEIYLERFYRNLEEQK